MDKVKSEQGKRSNATSCSVSWDNVKRIVYWTLENARHLEPTDHYLIEKEIDKCLLELNSNSE